MKYAGMVLLALAAASASAAEVKKGDPLVARGRYVAQVGGCNDCHTPGYAMSGGKVPDAEWLQGDVQGWSGPWGTTYPVNLRLYMQQISEAEWVKKAKSLSTRPPMPWFNVRAMSERDLRALYRFIRHLGPAGKPAPAYLPPDQRPAQPYVQFPLPPK